MHDSKLQVEDVNHFDNTVVVKFEDGAIALLNGVAVREAIDTVRRSPTAAMPQAVDLSALVVSGRAWPT